MDATTKLISVVIPAYNEEKLIARCLDGFVKQKTSHRLEVILVDNNSSDKTVTIAKRYKDTLDLRIIRQKVKGRGIARKTGADSAKGNIILSSDADAIVPQDWVEKMSTYFDNPNIFALTGVAEVESDSKIFNGIFKYAYFLAMYMHKMLSNRYPFAGYNFGIRKEIYEKVGGFNPILDAYEDYELSSRVNKVVKVTFKKDVKVTISHRRFGKNFFKIFHIYGLLGGKYLLGMDTRLGDVR